MKSLILFSVFVVAAVIAAEDTPVADAGASAAISGSSALNTDASASATGGASANADISVDQAAAAITGSRSPANLVGNSINSVLGLIDSSAQNGAGAMRKFTSTVKGFSDSLADNVINSNNRTTQHFKNFTGSITNSVSNIPVVNRAGSSLAAVANLGADMANIGSSGVINSMRMVENFKLGLMNNSANAMASLVSRSTGMIQSAINSTVDSTNNMISGLLSVIG